MFKFLVKLFVKDSENKNNVVVRKHYGYLTGFTGIILNLILSIGKILTGAILGAISILSDGINNLSDAGSSIVSLVGFKLSSKKPDKEHPFGHGRMEYFSALAVSVIILIVAFELLTSSINKIITNEVLIFSSKFSFYLSLGVLISSILIKLWLGLFNLYIGKKIDSLSIKATATDCFSDILATSVVLICSIISLNFKGFSIDGYAGVIVSLFIGYTGIKSLLEVCGLLLGNAPDKDFVKEIEEYVTNYDENVVGIHDLIVHDYGPSRVMITLHVEVPADKNIMALHDMIDNIEVGLGEKFNCLATIHLDPVVTNNERVTLLKAKCKEILNEISSDLNLHDFRMNEGDTHSNLIFDVVKPYNCKIDDKEIISTLNLKLKEYDQKLNCVVKIENSYV